MELLEDEEIFEKIQVDAGNIEILGTFIIADSFVLLAHRLEGIHPIILFSRIHYQNQMRL